MKSAPSSSRPTHNARSIRHFVPLASLILLILSRTALRHTRFEDSTFGVGLGLLLGYSILNVFPCLFQPKEPEDNDLQTLNLSR